MRILLIDNHTVHIPKFLSLLLCDVQVVLMEELTSIDLNDYDGVVLSGGSRYVLLENLEKYGEEINIIKNFLKPLLGICMGFEVLCYTYGEKIEYLGFRELGALRIEIIKNDSILHKLNPDSFVYECHRWKVSQLSFLNVLAKSSYGVEIVKHPKLPHYGVQFHPEVLLKDQNAQQILINFLEIVREYR